MFTMRGHRLIKHRRGVFGTEKMNMLKHRAFRLGSANAPLNSPLQVSCAQHVRVLLGVIASVAQRLVAWAVVVVTCHVCALCVACRWAFCAYLIMFGAFVSCMQHASGGVSAIAVFSICRQRRRSAVSQRIAVVTAALVHNNLCACGSHRARGSN